MALSAYRELRALVGKNRYGYVAIIFTDDPVTGHSRVGLDTPHVGHRFIGLSGPLDECLALAQKSSVDQLKRHPYCKIAPTHNRYGTWKAAVSQWLQW